MPPKELSIRILRNTRATTGTVYYFFILTIIKSILSKIHEKSKLQIPHNFLDRRVFRFFLLVSAVPELRDYPLLSALQKQEQHNTIQQL